MPKYYIKVNLTHLDILYWIHHSVFQHYDKLIYSFKCYLSPCQNHNQFSYSNGFQRFKTLFLFMRYLGELEQALAKLEGPIKHRVSAKA